MQWSDQDLWWSPADALAISKRLIRRAASNDLRDSSAHRPRDLDARPQTKSGIRRDWHPRSHRTWLSAADQRVPELRWRMRLELCGRGNCRRDAAAYPLGSRSAPGRCASCSKRRRTDDRRWGVPADRSALVSSFRWHPLPDRLAPNALDAEISHPTLHRSRARRPTPSAAPQPLTSIGAHTARCRRPADTLL